MQLQMQRRRTYGIMQYALSQQMPLLNCRSTRIIHMTAAVSTAVCRIKYNRQDIPVTTSPQDDFAHVSGGFLETKGGGYARTTNLPCGWLSG